MLSAKINVVEKNVISSRVVISCYQPQQFWPCPMIPVSFWCDVKVNLHDQMRVLQRSTLKHIVLYFRHVLFFWCQIIFLFRRCNSVDMMQNKQIIYM